MAEYVADMAEVVSRLPTAPVLVGDSLGGMVVRKYLESRHVPAAVLMAPEEHCPRDGAMLPARGAHEVVSQRSVMTTTSGVAAPYCCAAGSHYGRYVTVRLVGTTAKAT